MLANLREAEHGRYILFTVILIEISICLEDIITANYTPGNGLGCSRGGPEPHTDLVLSLSLYP
jgi:hypothetical protein